jgi:hypothetical protein
MGRDSRVSALALFSEELRRAWASDVAYLDNALADQVAERTQDVARVAFLYDILMAEALSPRASADLARKAIERWT